MQKKIALLIVGITVGLTIGTMIILMFITKGKGEPEERLPEPTAFNERQREDENQKEARAAWIEQMHAAAPGTDWRKMDLQTRMELAANRSLLLQTGGTRSDSWDTLAMGNLIGKWSETGSFNTAGRMRATEVDFENNTVYTFTQGGNLWKGDLNGVNWAVINDHFNIQSAHFLRKTDSLLIVATDAWATQSVYRTADEGISWEACSGLENMTEWGYIMDVEMLNDTAHTIYALVLEWDYTDWGAITSLYKSTDWGENFALVNSYREDTHGTSNTFAIWAPRYGSADLYLAGGDTMYVLTPADLLPVAVQEMPVPSSGTRLFCGYQDTEGTSLYVANSSFGSTQIYASDDAGITWEVRGSIDQGNFSKASFNCSQTEKGFMWFGGVDCYRSFNGGNSFSKINEWWEYYGSELNKLHADIPYIFSFLDTVADEELLLISTDGGLYTSANNGLSNVNITMEGMRNAQYYDIYTYRLVPEVIFAGSQDQGFQRSNFHIDNQYYFDQLISGDYGHLVSNDGGDYLWMVYPGFVMLAEDASGPANLYFWDFPATNALWLPPIMEDPEDPKVVWWGGGDHLYKITQSGGSINGVQQSFDFDTGLGGNAIAAIAYSPINTDYWYVLMSNGTFYTSVDRGVTWTRSIGFDGPDSHYFYGSSIIPSTTDLNKVYIGGSGYSNPPVYVSTDNGASFVSMSEGLPSTLVYDMAILPGDSMLFAATEVAPYVFIPEENAWFEMGGTDAPYQTYWAVEYVDTINTVRFGTYGRGIWDFKLYEEPEPPVGISDISIPDFIVYPQPAHDILMISSQTFLPDVAIGIYNAEGALVKSVNSAAFNKNSPYRLNIEALSPGLYFVEMRYRNEKLTKKIIVY